MISAILEFLLDVASEIVAALWPLGRDKVDEWRKSDSLQLRLIALLVVILGIALVAAIVAVVIAII